MANVGIKAAIASAQAQRSKRTEVSADRVLAELARLGFSDMRKLFDEQGALKPIGEWSDDVAAAVASLEVLEEWEGSGESRRLVGHTKKLKLWDKNSALKTLAQHLGMLVQKVEVKGNVGRYTDMSDAEVEQRIRELEQREARPPRGEKPAPGQG